MRIILVEDDHSLATALEKALSTEGNTVVSGHLLRSLSSWATCEVSYQARNAHKNPNAAASPRGSVLSVDPPASHSLKWADLF